MKITKLLILTLPLLTKHLYINAQSDLPKVKWKPITIKDKQRSPAFVDTKDLNGDGFQEILLSTLQERGGGPIAPSGALRLFYQPSKNMYKPWKEYMIIGLDKNLGFINHPYFMDVDEDGYTDILIQQGFLTTETGSYQWLKGPFFKELKPISIETESDTYFWHESVQVDVDQDGYKDLITTSSNTKSFPFQKRIEWYKNHGNGKFTQHIISETFGGVFIKNYDIDQDGDQDIIVSQFFKLPNEPSLLWLELQEKPNKNNDWQGVWIPHTIDNTSGLGYHLEFYDIDVDGKEELIYGNHNNTNNPMIVDPEGNPIESGIYWFEIPENPAKVSTWERHTIDEGFPINTFDFGRPSSQGSPGIFSIGDLDKNGLPDIALPGDGTKNLFYLQQQKDHTFKRSIIAKGTMYGMAKITDINGDGKIEVLSAMHNAPEDETQVGDNAPLGNLKIYIPKISRNDNVAMNHSINLFPTQSTTHITIDLNSREAQIIQIYDINNNLVHEYKGNTDTTIDVSNWKKGLYFMKSFRESENPQITKFIKR